MAGTAYMGTFLRAFDGLRMTVAALRLANIALPRVQAPIK